MPNEPELPPKKKRRLGWWGCLGAVGAAVALPPFLAIAITTLLFPGQQMSMAWEIGTGIGNEGLQAEIDRLEAKAIAGESFSASDKAFLKDFYTSLATGAKLSMLVAQTGHLMDHYLEGSGEDFKLEARIFTDNTRVQKQMEALRRRADTERCKAGRSVKSRTFHMPHRSSIDSVFGLYYGTLHLALEPQADGCLLHWRAEVPWHWPSYKRLKRKHGRYHAESFPVPNMTSLALGDKHALFVDNGLGEHLVQLGLAEPFLAYGTWRERR